MHGHRRVVGLCTGWSKAYLPDEDSEFISMGHRLERSAQVVTCKNDVKPVSRTISMFPVGVTALYEKALAERNRVQSSVCQQALRGVWL